MGLSEKHLIYSALKKSLSKELKWGFCHQMAVKQQAGFMPKVVSSSLVRSWYKKQFVGEREN